MKQWRTLVAVVPVLVAAVGLVPVAATSAPLAGLVPLAPAATGGDDAVVNITLTDEQGEATDILDETASDLVLTQELATPEFVVAGVTWSAAEQLPATARIFLRTLEDGVWSAWLETNVEASPAGAANATNGTEPYITGGATAVQMRITGVGDDAPSSLALTLVPHDPSLDEQVTISELPTDAATITEDAPVTTPAPEPTSEELSGTALGGGTGARGTASPLALAGLRALPPTAIRAAAYTADTPAGPIVTRAGWGADEAYTDANWTPRFYPLEAAVVHHTAGTNSYTAAQSAGIVKAIFAYHTGTRGWGDIGYNFLFDKYGQVFEGRKYSVASPAGTPAGSLIEAGHASGFNRGTLGVSAMGNFDAADAPSAGPIVDAMARVVAWKFALANIDPASRSPLLSPATRSTTTYPTGSQLPRIFGHRDVASTACPGSVYNQLPALRTSVANRMAARTAPVSSAGVDRTIAAGSTFTLEGSASGTGELSYAWTQTSGPAVSLTAANSARPSFVAPAGTGQLVFSLVASAGGVQSAPDTVTITVTDSGRNLARSASVTVSSQNAATSQTGGKAIDGLTLGHPVDHTGEWATQGGRANSWIQLALSGAATVNRVVLHDRPNTADQATAGTLTFSDGSSVSVGALNNDGAATTVTFADRTVTWVRFTATAVSATTANAGLAEFEVWGTPSTPAPTAANVARSASVAVSSQNAATSQTGVKAIDGSILGHPVDHTREWATQGGRANSWIQLTLSGPATVNRVVLHDRPNTADQATAGTLTFSDGSSVSVGALNNDGAATTVTFADRTVTWVRFTATAVSATTANAGLAEFQVWGTPAASAPTPASANVARSASVAVSSQNAATSQTGVKAIDGSILGHPVDHTREWATQGGRASSWIQLTLSGPATVNRVVLHDRPNTADQVTAGTLTFSDGSSVSVGALNNDGAATTVTFADRTVTWVRFTATAVSATTANAGLAEFQVWGF